MVGTEGLGTVQKVRAPVDILGRWPRRAATNWTSTLQVFVHDHISSINEWTYGGIYRYGHWQSYPMAGPERLYVQWRHPERSILIVIRSSSNAFAITLPRSGRNNKL